MRARPGAPTKPSEAVSLGKGGARERAEVRRQANAAERTLRRRCPEPSLFPLSASFTEPQRGAYGGQPSAGRLLGRNGLLSARAESRSPTGEICHPFLLALSKEMVFDFQTVRLGNLASNDAKRRLTTAPIGDTIRKNRPKSSHKTRRRFL